MTQEPPAAGKEPSGSLPHGEGDGEASGKPLALICDDDELALDLMSWHMGQAGFEVIRATNGKIAISLLQERPPAIVLLDMVMPVATGEDVMRYMRADPVLSQIPVVVVTSRRSVREAVSAFHEGAVDFVTKPFDPEDLIQCVRQALAAKGRESR